MSNESIPAGTKTEVRGIVLWILGIFGSMYMLYYEYRWFRFAFHDVAPISFNGWFRASFAIAVPWMFGFASVIGLKRAAKNGAAGHDVFFNISLLTEMAVISAYWILAPEIQRLTGLSALK